MSCGGTYIKVKEPEGYGKKNKKTSEKKTAGNGKLSETVKGDLVLTYLQCSGLTFQAAQLVLIRDDTINCD